MSQTTNTMQFSDSELSQRREFDRSRPRERDASKDLIGSDRVEDTNVYSADGEKIGHISKLMIGKRSGRVEYAVMSFGGFLGIGEDQHPLPWEALDYDESMGGYVVNIDKDRLREAPRYSASEEPTYDQQFGERVYAYYGVLY
ncbi:PRC-barrel domain-containing protein [Aurantiacibacter suaedae]|uniref:PRC-barrel domain-containing protein n=1 Tax=Aurantiacibacter suaedae TaxID=2545755 RepID=UPI001F4F7328|nr:PRC-barrel domain-containing protein [Aurantiacibacter suaedae]